MSKLCNGFAGMRIVGSINSIQFNSILYFRLNIIFHKHDKVVHSGYIKIKYGKLVYKDMSTTY